MLKAIRNLIGISPKYESDKYATSPDVVILKHDSFKGRTVQGIVKYVGPRCESGLVPGDYVFYSAYSGQLWAWKGELILFMEEDEILCKADNIPEFNIPGLYMRERIDKTKNEEALSALYDGFLETIGQNKLAYTVKDARSLDFIEYLSSRIDAYGAYFEAPHKETIELVADAFKEQEWTNTVKVGHEVKPQNLELYKDEKLTCRECGGVEVQVRERSTTKIFYQCKKCGNIRDRQMYKDIEK